MPSVHTGVESNHVQAVGVHLMQTICMNKHINNEGNNTIGQMSQINTNMPAAPNANKHSDIEIFSSQFYESIIVYL